MNCTKIQADLSAFLDGELGESRTQEVYEHLTNCAGCRKSTEVLEAASTAFRELAPAAVSADFAAGMARDCAVPVDASDKRRWRGLVPVAMAAVLVLAFIWWADDGVDPGIVSEGPELTVTKYLLTMAIPGDMGIMSGLDFDAPGMTPEATVAGGNRFCF